MMSARSCKTRPFELVVSHEISNISLVVSEHLLRVEERQGTAQVCSDTTAGICKLAVSPRQ